MDLISDAHPIGRTMPSEKFTGVIHCAVSKKPHELDGFNLALRTYCNRFKPRLVVIGSCWQLLAGETFDTEYAIAKRKQSKLFPEATELIPYWIFGEGKGFVWNLVQALRGKNDLKSAGMAPRDFVSVTDVARDAITALEHPAGSIGSYTDCAISPFDLAEKFGLKIDAVEPQPYTVLDYPIGRISTDYESVIHWITNKIQEN